MVMGWLPDPELAIGLYDLTTEAGVWKGTFSGIEDSGTYQLEGLLLGVEDPFADDDLHGLQYRIRASSEDGLNFNIEGIIEETT